MALCFPLQHTQLHEQTLPVSSVGGFSSVKETSSTMKSGQEKPTGKFSFRASVEQEKSP